MGKKIGGSQFIRNGLQYDYCFRESILSLLEFCDEVQVVDAGSDDGTQDVLSDLEKQFKHLHITYLSKEHWDSQHGREKLSYFHNMAIDKLSCDYNFSLQSDEIVHEGSYGAIRAAVEKDHEGVMCRRINLWESPYLQLSVPLNRMPCSEYVVRLAKPKYKHYDDGESIGVIANEDFAELIRIYHMGFVRKREVMKAKITNMQVDVFGFAEADRKLQLCDVFNPQLWFANDDLKPIDELLPKVIQKWASERVY